MLNHVVTMEPLRRATLAAHAPIGVDALRVLTLSHRTAAFADLARMALPAPAQAALVQRLRDAGLEAVVLCTCNRTELYWYSRSADDDAVARAALIAAAGSTRRASGDGFDRLRGGAAARHLFRVAAGLESLVVGEAEVLGQVRAAIETAERLGLAGFFLPALFHAALRFGGRARTETRIGQGALSVASAAVQLLTRLHPDLSDCTVVVIGAGVTGLKAARHLRAERVGRLVVLNRTPQRACDAAAEVGAEAGTLEDLPRWLAEADAVLAAVHVDAPLLTAERVRAALPNGRATPLALIDLSLPRAMDPGCAAVAGVALHDLSGLEEVVARNRALREHEIPRVESLLAGALAIFESQARESAARPLVAELRRRAEAIRRQELHRVLKGGAADEAALERMTRRIVDRLLQGPSAALRRGDLALDTQHVHYLRAILGLADPDADLAGEVHEGLAHHDGDLAGEVHEGP